MRRPAALAPQARAWVSELAQKEREHHERDREYRSDNPNVAKLDA
jgi:hypothetical protein